MAVFYCNLSGTADVIFTLVSKSFSFGTGVFSSREREEKMQKITGLDFKIQEMAARIRELREIEGISIEDMAVRTGVTPAEYADCESGRSDLNFTFIYRCALVFGVNVTDIIEGYSPNLRSYTVTRAGGGQTIAQAHGMTYYNLAYAFQNRIAEPLYVRSVYDEAAQHHDIELTSHAGQECDIVIDGQLMVQIGDHKEILSAGDSIYYNSSTPHGMIAIGGEDCYFYAIVLLPDENQEKNTTVQVVATPAKKRDTENRIYNKFITAEEDENGAPLSITYKGENSFNFAYDVIDVMATQSPDDVAVLWTNDTGETKKITWPAGKEVLKGTLITLACIAIIGIAVFLVDLGLTSGIDALREAADNRETTTSAVSTAISLPKPPIAIPTFAFLRDGASFIPSPIIATLCPRICSLAM